jgi:hypothetical protein
LRRAWEGHVGVVDDPVEDLTSATGRAEAGVASSCFPDRAGPGALDLLAEAAQQGSPRPS